MHARLYFRLPLDPARLLRARQRISDYLDQHSVDRHTIDDVVLAIEEAMTNAVRHSGARRDLEVRLCFEGRDLRAVVEDRGKGFDFSELHLERPPDPLATGGRGLFLINQLMDHLELVCNGGLEVRMVRREALPDGAAPAILESGVVDAHQLSGTGHREERLRSMVEEIAEGYAALDWEYRFTYANAAALQLYHRSPDDILGHVVWEIFPHIENAPLGRAIRDAVELGVSTMLEFHSEALDRWLECRFYPTGSGASLYLHDIEERHRREAERDEYLVALTESEERFRTLFDSMTEGVALHELVYDDGRAVDYLIVDVNPAFSRQTGVAAESVRGLLASEAYGTGSPPYLERYADVVARQQPLLFETHFEPMHRYFQITAVSLGEARFATVFEDVTERRLRERALHESERRLRIAQEATGFAVYEYDVATGRIQWDERVYDLWGLDRGQTVTYDDFITGVHKDDRATTQSAVDAALDPAGDGRYEATYRVVDRRDGRVRWVRATGLVTFAEGKATRLIGTVEDITDRRRMQERSEQELRTTRLLLEATESLVSPRSPEVVLETLTDLTLRLTGRSRVTVSLWDDQTEELVIAASTGDAPLEAGRRVSLQHISEPAREAVRGQTSRTIDYDALPHGERGVGDEVPSHLALDVPLVYQGRFVGLLALDDPGDRREFSPQEIRLVEGMASQAAVAIETARLLTAEQERARLAETLTQIDTGLRSSLDRHEMMRRAVAEGTQILGADSGAITVHHHDHFVVEYAHGFAEDPIGLVMPDELERHSVHALETRQLVLVQDVTTDPRVDGDHLLSFGIRAVIVVPLVVAGEAVADLFFNFATPRRFSAAEVEFARRLGSSLSLALENAQLYEEQQRIATTLQENLIHPLPSVEGLELAAHSLTANQPELVGGDFSDVFLLPSGLVAIVIGDVAGKGIRAAGLTETVRSTVRAFAAIDSAPAFILRKTNELLIRHEPGEPHVTCLVGVLDPTTGHLTAASAGHPPPVHLSPFSCRLLEMPFGPPLGTFPADYQAIHETLTVEDAVVLYTDGVTEAGGPGGELFGERRLVETVQRLRGSTAEQVALAVAEAALAHGRRLRDDLHVVALRLA